MKRKELFYLFIIATVAFILIEAALRFIFNIHPGNHHHSIWFKKVDSLEIKQGFTADSSGVFKVDADVAEFLSARLQSDSMMNLTKDETNKNLEVYGLDYQFYKIEEKNCILGQLVESTLKKQVKDGFDSAIISYSKNPINKDGFRSISFKKHSSKKKILLLGDSFTWGHNAEPLGNSFADYLLSKGFEVYNTGISGSDPEQYLAVAEKYIPVLKPDYVIVNFYTGNDVQYFRRKPQPNIPIFYSTNAGNILSCPEGVTFFNAKESYEYAISRVTIPQSGIFNRLCSLTSFGTLFWKVANKMGWCSQGHPKYAAVYKEQDKQRLTKPSANSIVNEIHHVAKCNNSHFFLVSIPNIESGKLRRTENIEFLFEDTEYFEVPTTDADYIESNFHYNNQGHLKHGKFLEELINKSEAAKTSF